ncbi:hypothetical protein B0H17DRAFT_641897 [Mycena rosella]|uniref:Sulfotransferase family protein n=1 Tax=Mycena rosella TaxID=1033263 RepID=A0AAD7BF09_MYCRO|nr:hypothetical protein B0H17DRAFT_641897 [Mycena rosella]
MRTRRTRSDRQSISWVNRRGAARTVPMQVLVLGYPRTGTTSMRDALEILGYKGVHHMEDIFANPLEAGMWTEAINARFFARGTPYRREEWDQLLGHCQAVTDTPAAMFAEDLVAAYPGAKVILTNRDVDKWWTSFCDSIGSVVASRRYRLAAYLDPRALGTVSRLGKLIMSVILGPIVTEAGAKARFTAHYEKVRKIVPKERLLEYDVAEGWGRCAHSWGRMCRRWTFHTQMTPRCGARGPRRRRPSFSAGLQSRRCSRAF